MATHKIRPRAHQPGPAPKPGPGPNRSQGGYCTEIVFWLWSLLFAAAEMKEFRSYDQEGLRMYLRSGWNQLDCLNLICTLTVCALRLRCDPEPLPESTMNATGITGGTSGGGDGSEKCEFEVWSRNLYSGITFMLYWKMLSYAEYYEMIGVHVIIMEQVKNRRLAIIITRRASPSHPLPHTRAPPLCRWSSPT